MRHLRPFAALLAIAAITVACSTPGASSGASSGSQSSEGPGASQSAAASQPAASSGGGGGGANGSVTFQITGDYTASGELPFIPLGLSTFTNNGWFASFADSSGSKVIQINSMPNGYIVNYADAGASVPGTEANGCTFTFTKNDSSGLAGSFECHAVQGLKQGTATLIHVDFSGHFDAHQ